MRSYTDLNLGKKIYLSKKLNNLGTDKSFHNLKYTTINAALPSY